MHWILNNNLHCLIFEWMKKRFHNLWFQESETERVLRTREFENSICDCLECCNPIYWRCCLNGCMVKPWPIDGRIKNCEFVRLPGRTGVKIRRFSFSFWHVHWISTWTEASRVFFFSGLPWKPSSSAKTGTNRFFSVGTDPLVLGSTAIFPHSCTNSKHDFEQ